MPGPTFLETDRLRLAPAEEDDLDFLVEAVNHPQVRAHVSVFRTPFDEEQYREAYWPPGGDDGVSLLVVPNAGEFADEPVGSV